MSKLARSLIDRLEYKKNLCLSECQRDISHEQRIPVKLWGLTELLGMKVWVSNEGAWPPLKTMSSLQVPCHCVPSNTISCHSSTLSMVNKTEGTWGFHSIQAQPFWDHSSCGGIFEWLGHSEAISGNWFHSNSALNDQEDDLGPRTVQFLDHAPDRLAKCHIERPQPWGKHLPPHPWLTFLEVTFYHQQVLIKRCHLVLFSGFLQL